jgi:hypothetical protein
VSWGDQTLRAPRAAALRLPEPAAKTAPEGPTVNKAPADATTAAAARSTGGSPADAREMTARRYLAMMATAFCTIFALVWIYTAAMPMAFLSRDYPAWIAKRTILTSCQLGSALFFGDSRTMAGIDPRQLPFPSSNLAFSGSSPIEAYFAVKRALLCSNRPKVVVIAYSPGKFMNDVDYWNISTRVGILNFADMLAVQQESRALHSDEIQALRRSDHLVPLVREALFAVHFPPFYFNSLINGYVFGRYLHNRAAERQILADRGHAFFGTDAGSDIVASEATMPLFAPSPVINAYFTAGLAALRADGIPVVILSLPINKATCQMMDPALRVGLTQYLAKTIAAYPGTRIAGPMIPCWPNRLFGDAFHLNAAGAAAYAPLVADWLRPDLSGTDDSPRVVQR